MKLFAWLPIRRAAILVRLTVERSSVALLCSALKYTITPSHNAPKVIIPERVTARILYFKRKAEIDGMGTVPFPKLRGLPARALCWSPLLFFLNQLSQDVLESFELQIRWHVKVGAQ